MTVIHKSNCKCWWGWEGRGTLTLPVGLQTGAATTENCVEVLQKLKMELSWPSNSTSGSAPEEIRSTNSKGHTHPCSRQQYLQEPSYGRSPVAINKGRMETMWGAHTHNEYYSAINKKELNLTVFNNFDGPRRYYAEWNVRQIKTNTT